MAKRRLKQPNPAKSRNPHNHWVQNGWAITYTEGMYSSRVKAELSGWKNSFHDTFRVTAEETYKGSKEFDVTVEGGEVDTNSLGWAKFKEYAIERGVTKKDAKTLLFTTAQVILGFKPDPKKAGGEVENRVKNGALEFRTKSHRDQVAQLLRRHPQSFGSRVFEQDSRSRSAGRSKKSPAYLIVAPGVGQDELSRWWQRAVEADHARNPQKPKRK